MTEVNSLEDKIKEYLDTTKKIFTNEQAHDIAEIAEKENAETFVTLGNVRIGTRTKNKISKLEKENAELKQQLADIKYLDRDEVEKIIEEFIKNTSGCSNSLLEDVEDLKHYESIAITAICNLAYDKNKIIKVLSGYWPFYIPDHDKEAIADEILNDK